MNSAPTFKNATRIRSCAPQEDVRSSTHRRCVIKHSSGLGAHAAREESQKSRYGVCLNPFTEQHLKHDRFPVTPPERRKAICGAVCRLWRTILLRYRGRHHVVVCTRRCVAKPSTLTVLPLMSTLFDGRTLRSCRTTTCSIVETFHVFAPTYNSIPTTSIVSGHSQEDTQQGQDINRQRLQGILPHPSTTQDAV